MPSSHKTPFEPFVPVKLRFWSERQVPHLTVDRATLRTRGLALEERLVASVIDGMNTLGDIGAAMSIDHADVCGIVEALHDRRIVTVD